jgi:hypothetical protein
MERSPSINFYKISSGMIRISAVYRTIKLNVKFHGLLNTALKK